MAKFRCPRCSRIYATQGEPTKNPGGLGAKDGWTCITCVDLPPLQTRVEYAQAQGSPFAVCWHPVYLEPYEGDEPVSLTIVQLPTTAANKPLFPLSGRAEAVAVHADFRSIVQSPEHSKSEYATALQQAGLVDIARLAAIKYGYAARHAFVAGLFDAAEDCARKASCYCCLHCGAVADKQLWGPGRITCPLCNMIAPSPADIADAKSYAATLEVINQHPEGETK